MPKFTAGGNTATEPEKRTFVSGSGGGNFPKAADLFGALVMLTPVEVETVPGYEGKGTTERLTADTVVLDGPHQGEYPSMWWSQSPIVSAAKAVLRKNKGEIILGRLYRFPQSSNKAKYPTRQDIEKALARWRPGRPDVNFAWALEKFTEEDQELAERYLDGDLEFEAAELEGDDAFEDD